MKVGDVVEFLFEDFVFTEKGDDPHAFDSDLAQEVVQGTRALVLEVVECPISDGLDKICVLLDRGSPGWAWSDSLVVVP